MYHTNLTTLGGILEVTLDPTGWYGRNSHVITPDQFIIQYHLIIGWLASFDHKEFNLDKIWDFYQLSKPTPAAELPEVVLDADKMYCYVGDPPLAPIIEISTTVKGKLEVLYAYPHDFIAYVVDGVLINSGRMD